MNPEEIEELIALESLGALEPEDRRRLDEALAADPALQARVDEMREIAAGLAWTATPERPSGECQRRILDAIRRRVASETPAPICHWEFAWLPWAIAATVLILASYVALHTSYRPPQTAAAVAAPQIVLVHLRAVNQASPAFADVAWDCKTGCGNFCAQRMPPPPPGKCYQVWVMAPGGTQAISAGVFHPGADGNADFMVHPDEPVKVAAKILVSLEVEGGVKQAQGPMVLESI